MWISGIGRQLPVKVGPAGGLLLFEEQVFVNHPTAFVVGQSPCLFDLLAPHEDHSFHAALQLGVGFFWGATDPKFRS